MELGFRTTLVYEGVSSFPPSLRVSVVNPSLLSAPRTGEDREREREKEGDRSGSLKIDPCSA
jgi:hypothetical protein